MSDDDDGKERKGIPLASNGNVVRYHKRYALLQVAVFLVVVGAFFALIVRQILLRQAADIEVLAQRFEQHVHFIGSDFGYLRKEMTKLRMSAEEDLFESRNADTPMHRLFQFLKSTPDGKAFHLDEIGPPYRSENIGNLTGDGSLEDRSPDWYREISMALGLIDDFNRLAATMPNLTWIYYYSADNFAVYYPWVLSTETRFEKESYKLTAWTLGLPANNPNREPYWTEVYFDSVGKGLMVSCLAPIYDEDRFVGVVGADWSVDYLNEIVASFEPERGGRIVLYDQFDHLLAAPGQIAATDGQIRGLGDRLPSELGSAQDRLREIPPGVVETINGWHVLKADLAGTPFRALWFERAPSTAEMLVGHIGSGGFALLCGLTIILLVSLTITHLAFVRPSEKFVRHLLVKSKGKPSVPDHSIPQAWRPWFETITRVFDENTALTEDLEKRNRDLREEMRERKRAEEVLRHSEERYRTLFESSRDAIMTLAPPTWQFTSGNPATVEMFRAKDEKEFASKGPWDLSPERQPDGQLSSHKAKMMIEQAMRDGSHFFEWMHQRLDGEDFPATVLLTRTNIAGQQLLQATVRDITESKRAEEALRSDKLLSEEYIDSLPGLFYVFDEQRFVRWNREWERVTGYSGEELASRYGTDFFEGVDRTLIGKRMLKVFREGVADAEAELVTKDGRRIPYYFTGLRKTLNGKDHLVGLGIDITERRAAEEALTATRLMLETAIAQSPSGILVADAPDVTIRLANTAALGIHGGDPKILTGIEVGQHSINWKTFRPDGTPYPPEQLPLSRAVLAGEETHDEEVVIRNENGEEHWVSANAAPHSRYTGSHNGGHCRVPRHYRP